jgi:hypothetical protein
MRHPSDGTLRRLLDEPVGVADTDREHVAECSACRSGLLAAREDATVIQAALSLDLATDADLDEAWRRLTLALESEARPRATASGAAAAPRRRWRPALSGPRIAAVAVVALLAGAGGAAAAGWLQIFRASRSRRSGSPRRISSSFRTSPPTASSTWSRCPRFARSTTPPAARARTGLSVPR